MTITISPETEGRMRERAQAEGLSVEAYVEQLVLEDQAWGEQEIPLLTALDVDFPEIQAAVMEGLEQAKRGEGRSATEVFAELRGGHGIPR